MKINQLNKINYFVFLSDNAIDYIDTWTEHFELFRIFSWIILDYCPDWSTVKKTMNKVGELGSFDVVAHSSTVFEQFAYVKNYCTDVKLAEWKSNKLPTDERWAEIFLKMQNNHFAFSELAQIIEFVLCLTGTSSPVERVFAKGKKIWKQESSNLQVDSLGALLQIKCNMDWSCIDFFNFLKTRPDLLRKISSQDKYDFKNPKKIDDSPMSVQFADSEPE